MGKCRILTPHIGTCLRLKGRRRHPRAGFTALRGRIENLQDREGRADPDHRESLDPIIEAGVRGCIGKNRTAEELVIAVHLVAGGGTRLPRRASRLVQRRIQNNGSALEARLAGLNEKELRVLALTARGFTAREIGIRIRRATKSVENYRSSIRRKLGITTRAEFVSVALETGLLDMDL